MSLANYRFLVADDHFLLRQMIDRALKEFGISKIDWASDGEDAIKKINTAYDAGNPYNIVCLDWGMPKMDGLAVLKQCRKDKRLDDMAIVMVTAEIEEISILTAVEAGATAYITKPFKADELTKKLDDLARWLEKRAKKAMPKVATAHVPELVLHKQYVVDAMRKAVTSTLRDMFGVAAQYGTHAIGKGAFAAEPFIVAAMDMVERNNECIFMVVFGIDAINQLLPKYGVSLKDGDRAVHDAVEEITNVMYGKLKKSLNAASHSFKMGLPHIILSHSDFFDKYNDNERLVLPFFVEDCPCHVAIMIKK